MLHCFCYWDCKYNKDLEDQHYCKKNKISIFEMIVLNPLVYVNYVEYNYNSRLFKFNCQIKFVLKLYSNKRKTFYVLLFALSIYLHLVKPFLEDEYSKLKKKNYIYGCTHTHFCYHHEK